MFFASLPGCAAGFGLLFIFTGATAVLRPLPTLGEVFKFTPPTNAAEGQHLASSLTQMYGIRDLYAGSTILAIWYRGDRELLGWSLLFGAGVAAIDSWASKRQLGRYDTSHVAVAAILLGLGSSLAGILG